MLRALQRAFFTAGNTHAKEMDAFFLEGLFAALGVGPERIAAVDDDVAGLEERDELLDHRVDRRAGLDHDLRFARALERADKFLEALREDEILAFAPGVGEGIDDGGGAVIDGDVEAFRLHVEDEVLAHHCEADQADITGAHVDFRVGLCSCDLNCAGGGKACNGKLRRMAIVFCFARRPCINTGFASDAAFFANESAQSTDARPFRPDAAFCSLAVRRMAI